MNPIRLLLGGLFLVAGCSRPAPPLDASSDSGQRIDAAGATDAGSTLRDAELDAGMDAASDAGGDSGADVGSVDAGAPHTFLVSGLDYPLGLEIRDGYLYWVNYGTIVPPYVPGSLMRCALPDCAGGPEVLATGLYKPSDLTIDATHVYVGGGTNDRVPLVRCAVDGCGTAEAITVDQCAPVSIAHAGSTLFWVSECNPGPLRSCETSGCTPTIFAEGFRMSHSLLLDGAALYWHAHELEEGIIYSCPVAGCGTPRRLWATSELGGGPRESAVAGDTLFWTAGGSSPAIWSCPIATCETEARRVVAERNPAGIAVHGAFLYWTDFGVSPPSALRRCALGDCAGTVETIAGDLDDARVEHFVVDEPYVYLSMPGIDPGTGSIVRVALP